MTKPQPAGLFGPRKTHVSYEADLAEELEDMGKSERRALASDCASSCCTCAGGSTSRARVWPWTPRKPSP